MESESAEGQEEQGPSPLGRMSLLGMPHTGQTQSKERCAICRRMSGEQSMEPMAPTPSVGMNPMMAKSTVRTKRGRPGWGREEGRGRRSG